MPRDRVQHALVVDLETLAKFDGGERAVEDDRDIALDRVDHQAPSLGAGQELRRRDGPKQIVPLSHQTCEPHIGAVERGQAIRERDDAVDVGQEAGGDLGGDTLAEGVVVGVGHARRSLGVCGKDGKFLHESGFYRYVGACRALMVSCGLAGRGCTIMQAQRSSGRGDFWLTPVLAMPRAIPAVLHSRGMTATLGLSGITVAQLVEAPYLRIGLMLHVALLLAGGLVLTAMATRSCRASAAEVAHDLRGPLISLQATLELLASDGFGALPEQARAMGATVNIAPLPRVAGDSCALFHVFMNLLKMGKSTINRACRLGSPWPQR